MDTCVVQADAPSRPQVFPLVNSGICLIGPTVCPTYSEIQVVCGYSKAQQERRHLQEERNMTAAFQLPAELTIYSVGTTRDALLNWLTQQDPKQGDQVDIDAALVDDIDGAGIQLLGALTLSLTERGVLWQVKDASAPLLEICGVLGSQTWLDRTAAKEVGA